MFLTNGALFANLLPRYPQIKTTLGLEAAVFGLTVAAFPAGALVAGLSAGVLIRRWGSGTVAVAGTILTSLGLLAAAAAPVPGLFAVALFFAGGMDAVTDVAQNAHGLVVQRRYGRSIINSFHAVWSIGSVLGGTMAAVALTLAVPLVTHLAVSAAVFSALALIVSRLLFPSPSDEAVSSGVAVEEVTDRSHGTRPHATRSRRGLTFATLLTITALVAIATSGAVVEDAGNTWAALYLSTVLHTPAGLAATGYIALVGAQFVGRLIGDGLVDRFGQRAVARAGALLAGGGMGLALAFPTVPGTVAGFAAAGLGVATLVPSAMQAADQLPGLSRGTGLTIVSWLMRLGFLLSPPLVGLIADHAGLRFGLLSIPLGAVVVLLLAGVLPRTRRTHP